MGLGIGVIGGGWWWLGQNTAPTPKAEPLFVRFDQNAGIETAMKALRDKGVVRNPGAMRLYAFVNRKNRFFKRGTYRVAPGMTADEVFAALEKPVSQMFRFPETNWARRSANLLERANITTAEEYMALWADPAAFQKEFEIPLPEKGNLEGYLFPDTYDLPPLLGARGVVERQLQAFEDKVMPLIEKPETLRRTLIIASMVELEVAKDEERPLVAGVIENRLKLGMPLQIDATINYALQKWRPLTYADLRLDHPYNTYRNKGLPPGPICSPSLKSIQAALKPAKHRYLYYVAMPDKYHLFSATYQEHLRNIQKRKAALRALGQ